MDYNPEWRRLGRCPSCSHGLERDTIEFFQIEIRNEKTYRKDTGKECKSGSNVICPKCGDRDFKRDIGRHIKRNVYWWDIFGWFRAIHFEWKYLEDSEVSYPWP